MAHKVKCYRCKKILDRDRTLFDGHFYCDEDCAVPGDDATQKPASARETLDKLATTFGFDKQGEVVAPFLSSFFKAISGNDGRVVWR